MALAEPFTITEPDNVEHTGITLHSIIHSGKVNGKQVFPNRKQDTYYRIDGVVKMTHLHEGGIKLEVILV